MTELEFIQSTKELDSRGVVNVLKLLGDGATVPFIARYRKEVSGGMDEVEIVHVRDESGKYKELRARQLTVIAKIESQGKLSDELKLRINTCFDPIRLEDIYLPFKIKRVSKADRARKAGLESLAKMIMSQRGGDPHILAERFLKGELTEVAEAIGGAKEIMMEWMNENEALRDRLRKTFQSRSTLTSKLVKGKDLEAAKYKDYFDYSGSLKHCPSHRFLAIYRGGREGFLSIKARPEDEDVISQIERFFVKSDDDCGTIVKEACKDVYRRMLRPSLETEILNSAKTKADEEAIGVFAKNLSQLLLAAPLGSMRVLAIDPGFRTGCKVVCIDEKGDLLSNNTIFPHPPQREETKAKSKIAQLVQIHNIQAIAIGDGTAGRETERMIKHIRFDREVSVFVVNEDGASIYSASSIGRKEFPNYDVTVRGAVSIGRRLMDPLAELVKIDPKSIGVGQYQHEVNQTRLKAALDDVVVSAVNKVGVDVNTASPYLLSYVSGLGITLAENIVAYRKANGLLKSRSELKKVSRLGDKAFEQAAGFLRIKDANNILDNSGVHPERYRIVNQMAKDAGVVIDSLIGDDNLISKLKWENYPSLDRYTFADIIKELKKPGKDPRKKVKILEFDHRLKTIDDLVPGMKITGIVSNVTNFGAFVNIGIKENGLIHKSNMADHFVEDPTQYISLHEHVQIEVLDVDISRKRIALSLLRD